MRIYVNTQPTCIHTSTHMAACAVKVSRGLTRYVALNLTEKGGRGKGGREGRVDNHYNYSWEDPSIAAHAKSRERRPGMEQRLGWRRGEGLDPRNRDTNEAPMSPTTPGQGRDGLGGCVEYRSGSSARGERANQFVSMADAKGGWFRVPSDTCQEAESSKGYGQKRRASVETESYSSSRRRCVWCSGPVVSIWIRGTESATGWRGRWCGNRGPSQQVDQ
jgi:hypothetical protein